VEVFGDRQHFFNLCIRELEKAELIIEQNMASKPHGRETDISVEDLEDIEEDLEIPETQEDKLKVILDLFKDKGLVTLTKYIKVFTLQGNSQILAVAHSKLNSDYITKSSRS
jgi:hypothetical protein